MKKTIEINGTETVVNVISWGEDNLEIELEGERFTFGRDGEDLLHKGRRLSAFAAKVLPSETKQVFVEELEADVLLVPKAQKAQGHHGGAGSLQSPMPGKIFKVLKGEGDEVKMGDPVLILEAMKMEHTIKAQQDGVVKKIHFPEGAQVQGGVELCEIE